MAHAKERGEEHIVLCITGQLPGYLSSFSSNLRIAHRSWSVPASDNNDSDDNNNKACRISNPCTHISLASHAWKLDLRLQWHIRNDPRGPTEGSTRAKRCAEHQCRECLVHGQYFQDIKRYEEQRGRAGRLIYRLDEDLSDAIGTPSLLSTGNATCLGSLVDAVLQQRNWRLVG